MQFSFITIGIYSIKIINSIRDIRSLLDFGNDNSGTNGNKRELHVDLSLEAINYETIESQKIYSTTENVSNEVVNCKYFTTNYIPLNDLVKISKNGNSFTVYMCVDGSFQLTGDGENFNYQKGDTVLIPAALTDFQLSGKASILEIYIS